MKKIFYIKLLFTRILGFIWRPHESKKEEMSLKISALETDNLGAQFSSWFEAQSELGTALAIKCWPQWQTFLSSVEKLC